MFSAVLDLPTLTQGALVALRLCMLSMTQLVSGMAGPHGPVSLLRRASGEETIETRGETIFPAGEDIRKSSFGKMLRVMSDGVR